MTHEMPWCLREKQNHAFILGFLTSSKTAPHLRMGWLFESWKIFVVLTHFSTTNYCKDYFECRAHSHFASLHNFADWLAKYVGMGLWWRWCKCKRFLDVHTEYWPCRYPAIHEPQRYRANIWSRKIQLMSHSDSAGWALKITPEEGPWIGLWKPKENRETIHSSIQAARGHHYRPAFAPALVMHLQSCPERMQSYLLHCWYSPVGWPDSRASPERDTGSLCVLLSFRRAKLGRRAVEYGTWACCAASWMDPGSTQMPLALQPQAHAVCTKSRCLDLQFLPSHTALSQHS